MYLRSTIYCFILELDYDLWIWTIYFLKNKKLVKKNIERIRHGSITWEARTPTNNMSCVDRSMFHKSTRLFILYSSIWSLNFQSWKAIQKQQVKLLSFSTCRNSFNIAIVPFFFLYLLDRCPDLITCKFHYLWWWPCEWALFYWKKKPPPLRVCKVLVSWRLKGKSTTWGL